MIEADIMMIQFFLIRISYKTDLRFGCLCRFQTEVCYRVQPKFLIMGI